MSKTVILVCAHKQDRCLAHEPYMPIQVGKAISSVDLGFTGDDTGDNISDKNRSFCELTAHYWAWKNLGEAEYVGLSHYRRYFDFGNEPGNVHIVRTESFFSEEHPLPDMDEVFKECDIVLSKPRVQTRNIYTEYARSHRGEDILTVREIVAERSPEYLDAFDKIFFENNLLARFNMFVMRRKDFEEYSEWLFDTLFEAERRIEVPKDPVQGRIFGYISERLLMVYALHKGMRVCYKAVYMVDDRLKPKSRWSYDLHRVINNAIFALRRLFFRH
ncbi:MAG: DUF4422 domain-containing protein [Alistipes sp.]|nr:DUF4422 domain-containing protein [Alistipes sp.]